MFMVVDIFEICIVGMGSNSKEDLKAPFLEQSNGVKVDGSRFIQNVDRGITTVMFKIRGVECASCSVSIESVLMKLNGVESVIVSPIQGQAVVKYVSELVSVSYSSWLFLSY